MNQIWNVLREDVLHYVEHTIHLLLRSLAVLLTDSIQDPLEVLKLLGFNLMSPGGADDHVFSTHSSPPVLSGRPRIRTQENGVL